MLTYLSLKASKLSLTRYEILIVTIHPTVPFDIYLHGSQKCPMYLANYTTRDDYHSIL